MRHPTRFLLTLPFVLPFAAVAQSPVTLDATITEATPESPPPVAPVQVSVDLAPADAGVAGDLAGAYAGTAEIGAGRVRIVVGKSDERLEQIDMICVDMDGDGEMGPAEKMPLTVQDRGRAFVGTPVDLGLQVGGRDMTAQASFIQFKGQSPRVAMIFPRYLLAETEVGGTPLRIGVIDNDLDGVFGSAGDRWGAAPEGSRGINMFGLSTMDEKPLIAGHLLSIAVDGEKIDLTATESVAPDPATLVSHRERVEHLWMERFDATAEQFAQQRSLDTSRPKTETPIDWKWVTFDEALAMGKETGKPVFIDVMAFWCVWCYRMDHTTYCDAEVAELLNEKFIPVKIIQEQDFVGDYDRVRTKLGAQGIPAMGIFSADGEVRHMISGWNKPEDFIVELNKGLD